MTHITIEKAKLEKVFYALTAAKHGNLDHEWTEEVLAICKQALAAAVQEPVAWPMEEQPDGSIIPVDPSELPSDYFTTPPAAQPAIVLQQAYRTSDAYTIGFKDGQAAQPAPVQEILAAFPLFDEQGLDEEKHHCEWTLLQDRKRLHAMLAAPAAQPAPVQPVAWIEHHKGGDNLEWDNPGGKCTPLYTTPPARPAPVLEGRDWSLLEATQESLREHMAEIKRLKAAQPAVPDAIGPNEDELPAYAAGWNDCRQAMLEMMK
jgi:hypothetical protein